MNIQREKEGKNIWKGTNKLLIKASILSVLLFVLIGIVSADPGPGIVLTVTPPEKTVQPGENATYIVEVESITTETESVTLSMEEAVPGWTYVFSNPTFILYNKGDNETSNLYVSVPSDAPVDEYESKVKAEALVPGWPPWFAEKSFFTILTTVIPEFQTILIPVIILLGSIFFFSKRKGGR